MGRDKALLPFGNSPTLTQYQLKRLEKYFKKCYISCKNSNKFDFEANFIEDIKTPISAPFIALISIFEKLTDEYIFVLSVDTPFFTYEDYTHLVNVLKDQDGVVAMSSDGHQPLCAIYKKTILAPLKELVKEEKFKFSLLYDKIEVEYVDYHARNSFDNLNFYDDYKKAIEDEKNTY